ncbi:MAG TPA: hypothetical protein PK450_01035 [Paracoccaceae bacterium]|nr:hypothetical protein [Paracoccaceae bacterium]
MKTLAFAAMIALSAAPAAFASTSQILSNSDRAEITRIVPGADLSNLTLAQAGALASALNNDESGNAVGGQIRAILNAPLVDTSRAALPSDAAYAVGGNSTRNHD